MAWLSTPPGEAKRTRLQMMEGRKQEPDYPECNAAHIVNYLFEIGPVSPAGMGVGPISHVEIAKWQENTGIELSSWEARAIRSLSSVYLAQAQDAKEANCPSPWVTEIEADKQVIADRVRQALRG